MIKVIINGKPRPLYKGTCFQCSAFVHVLSQASIRLGAPAKVGTGSAQWWQPTTYVTCPECGNEALQVHPDTDPTPKPSPEPDRTPMQKRTLTPKPTLKPKGQE